MKINHQYKFLVVTFFFLLLVSCNKKAAETAKEEEHHDESGVVELTQMQVKSAQIVLLNVQHGF